MIGTRITFAAVLAPLVAAVGKVAGGTLVVFAWLAQGRFTPAPSTLVASPVEWVFAAVITARTALLGFPEVSLLVFVLHALGLVATIAVYGLVFDILPRRRREQQPELRGVQR